MSPSESLNRTRGLRAARHFSGGLVCASSAPALLAPPVPHPFVVGHDEHRREDQKHHGGGQQHRADRSPPVLERPLLVGASSPCDAAHDLVDDHGQPERTENDGDDQHRVDGNDRRVSARLYEQPRGRGPVRSDLANAKQRRPPRRCGVRSAMRCGCHDHIASRSTPSTCRVPTLSRALRVE